jgi:hypothetical protein
MPLGLLPLGTGGAKDWLLNVGLVSLGTGGGSVSTGAIAACRSVGANCGKILGEKEKHEMVLHAFLPIEDIAQPARAPAAPAAELTSVASPAPFGMLRPRGESSLAGVVSGCSSLAEHDQMYWMENEPFWQHALRVFGRTSPRPEKPGPVQFYLRSERDNRRTMETIYFSLSTNAPATSPTTFPASSSTSNEFAHAIQAIRAATRAGGKLSFKAFAQAAPRTLRRVLCPSVGPRRPIRIMELVRMEASVSD